MKNFTSKAALEKIAKFPTGIPIDFDKIGAISFAARNITDSTIQGHINKRHRFNKINIIHSVLKSIQAENVNWRNCDIKDCVISNSRIDNCNFNDAAHINNQIRNTTFYQCSFGQTAITDSEFRETIFLECDLTHVIISTSRFYQCKFINCKTSNKIVESSLLFDCFFEKTNIQIETIIENFGLHESCFLNSKILMSSDGKVRSLTPKNVTVDAVEEISPIERFILAYFHHPTILIEGSRDVDCTFDFKNWLQLSKNPNRFRLLIERYHEFVMHNYEKDLVPFWMILKLHRMTGELSQRVETTLIDVYRSVMGVHMSLSRLVEFYLEQCDRLLRVYLSEKDIVLLVNGPIDAAYYYKALPQIFKNRSVRIKKVIKHNSPNELFLYWDKIHDFLPIITLFLATRLKFQLHKLVFPGEQVRSAELRKGILATKTNIGHEPSYPLDILSTELGFDNQANNYIFKLKAILPGNLLMQLQIELKTKIFGKIRKIILNIIPQSSLKAGNNS